MGLGLNEGARALDGGLGLGEEFNYWMGVGVKEEDRRDGKS